MDVIIFCGQSNMQGQTEGLPQENEVVQGAKEYRALTNSFVELKHPVGEDMPNEFIKAAHNGGGTLVPAFCRTYIEKTGKEVVAIHVAKGSTTIAEWLKGTQCYHYAKEKILAGLKKAREEGTVERVYFVWLQGESDGVIKTSKEEYLQRLIALKNQLKKDVGIDKFGVIRVGYFALAKEDNEAIFSAQEEAVKTDEEFIMLTRICEELSKDSFNKEFMSVYGHYNNKAQDMIGTAAGGTLGDFRDKNKEEERCFNFATV